MTVSTSGHETCPVEADNLRNKVVTRSFGSRPLMDESFYIFETKYEWHHERLK